MSPVSITLSSVLPSSMSHWLLSGILSCQAVACSAQFRRSSCVCAEAHLDSMAWSASSFLCAWPAPQKSDQRHWRLRAIVMTSRHPSTQSFDAAPPFHPPFLCVIVPSCTIRSSYRVCLVICPPASENWKACLHSISSTTAVSSPLTIL